MDRFINSINPNDKREKIILVGKGPSLDNLNIKAMNKQKKYDICTISDAMNLFPRHKFSIHYHFLSVKRCQNVLKNCTYCLLNQNIITDHKHRFESDFFDSVNNIYLFISKHIKIPLIVNGDFDVNVFQTLFNYCGSVVGAVNFLCGYMGYKEIRYIGFDGGLEVGKVEYAKNIYYKRKDSKIAGCINKYAESWKGAITMINKNYPDTKFLPLEDFLKNDKS